MTSDIDGTFFQNVYFVLQLINNFINDRLALSYIYDFHILHDLILRDDKEGIDDSILYLYF
jgi:hypothetical protein